MYSEPLFCRECKHLKTYCTMNNPAGLYHYCDLESCELENKKQEWLFADLDTIIDSLSDGCGGEK